MAYGFWLFNSVEILTTGLLLADVSFWTDKASFDAGDPFARRNHFTNDAPLHTGKARRRMIRRLNAGTEEFLKTDATWITGAELAALPLNTYDRDGNLLSTDSRPAMAFEALTPLDNAWVRAMLEDQVRAWARLNHPADAVLDDRDPKYVNAARRHLTEIPATEVQAIKAQWDETTEPVFVDRRRDSG